MAGCRLIAPHSTGLQGLSQLDSRQLALRGQAEDAELPSRPHTANVEYQLVKALEAYRQGNFVEANRWIATARRLNPHHVSAYELQLSIAIDTGDTDATIHSLQQVVAAFPESARLQNLAGNMLFHAGERTAGIAALQTAMRLEPNADRHVLDLAAVYVASGDQRAAEELLQTACNANLVSHSLPLALARLYEVTFRWDLAVMEYRSAISRGASEEAYARQLAHAHYQAGHFSEASQVYEASFQADVEPALCELAEYADAALRQQDYSRGGRALDQIAQLMPDKIRSIELLRGICALREGDVVRATGIFRAGLTIWPSDPDLHHLLELCQSTPLP